MIFCPKCKSILIPTKKGRATELKCGCGYKAAKKEKLVFKEEVKLTKDKEIEIIDKKAETLPKIKEECPKCKNQMAHYWIVQTRAGDEAATRFFKCTKCKHTWREYS